MITRLYQTQAQARGAYDTLTENGFTNESMALLLPPAVEVAEEATAETTATETPSAAGSDIATAMRAGRMLGEHTGFYLAELAEGNSLLIIEPPFGTSQKAEAILDQYNPLPITHKPPREPFVPFWERQTPLSSLLRMPLLTESDTPFSDFWGFKFRQEGTSHFSRWFAPLTPDFVFSSKLGMRLLSSNATPLSSKTGMPTSSSRLKGDSSSFGLPFKTKNATPLSSMFGLPLLTRREHFLYR
jgi:hypothetical protein